MIKLLAQAPAEAGLAGRALAAARPGGYPGRVSSRTSKPRHVDPEVWALVQALRQARDALPWGSAEARLVDGLHTFCRLEATGGSSSEAVVLAPRGPRWASVLAAVGAVARLSSEGTRRLLAPWAGVQPAAPVGGVSPHRSAAADFAAGVLDPDA
jgi:hypothetical protein